MTAYHVGITVTFNNGGWFAYMPHRTLGPYKSERAAWDAVDEEIREF